MTITIHTCYLRADVFPVLFITHTKHTSVYRHITKWLMPCILHISYTGCERLQDFKSMPTAMTVPSWTSSSGPSKIGTRGRHTSWPLNVKTTIPKVEVLKDTRAKKGLTRFFIRNQKTITTEVEDFLKHYESWYLMTLMNSANDLTYVESSELYNRMTADPVGTNDPDYNDISLYTTKQVIQTATATATDLTTTTTTTTTTPLRRSPITAASAVATAPSVAPTTGAMTTQLHWHQWLVSSRNINQPSYRRNSSTTKDYCTSCTESA